MLFMWKAHEKHLKSEKHTWSMKSTWKATKTADSTQISHFDLVSENREGQLGISYILVVFGGACMCVWCTYGHLCFCCFSYENSAFHMKMALFIWKWCLSYENSTFHMKTVLFIWKLCFSYENGAFHEYENSAFREKGAFHARKGTCKEL